MTVVGWPGGELNRTSVGVDTNGLPADKYAIIVDAGSVGFPASGTELFGLF